MKLFDVSERRHFPIANIALDTDVLIFNQNWGEANTYYADFAGLGFKYAPRNILEIGVRYGYSGLAVCTGSHDAGRPSMYYTGMDWEGVAYRSNGVAKENFLRFAPWVSTDIHFINTQLQEWPESVLSDRFDFINVDGDHSFMGALKDMQGAWSLLLPGGIMTVDDMINHEVERAVNELKTNLSFSADSFEFDYISNERGLAIFRKCG